MKKEIEGLGPPSAGSSVEHQKRTKSATWRSATIPEAWDEIPRAVVYMGSFCTPEVREMLYAEVRCNRALHFGVDESGWPRRDGPEAA